MSHEHAALIGDLARAIAAAASGDLDGARAIIADVHGTIAVNAQTTLPGMPEPMKQLTSAISRSQAVDRVFAYWVAKCDHARAKKTPERATAVLARLKDGYTESEVRKAIDGAAASAHVNEDTGQKYDDLTLICRNGSKLESFIARGVAATGGFEVEVEEASPTEEKIAQMRRKMSELRKAGRATEYEAMAVELTKLMKERA